MFDDCAECSSEKLCQLPDSNPDSESDSDSNSDFDSSCLVSFYRWETPDKHVTVIMLQKYISDPFEEATETFKESAVSFKRRIYSKRSQNRDYNHVKGINVLKKSMKQSMTKSTFGLMDAPHSFAPALRSIS